MFHIRYLISLSGTFFLIPYLNPRGTETQTSDCKATVVGSNEIFSFPRSSRQSAALSAKVQHGSALNGETEFLNTRYVRDTACS